ncbi:hypothetical protein [Amnibacterium kyonggiense]|uniref:hypothetical protein n=1 Tax=Amnibacterium kyonggiense TaxID=595671 RepID=UPI0013C345E1|nr:hypothetical protein [Amnibacterium kyonggiense]
MSRPLRGQGGLEARFARTSIGRERGWSPLGREEFVDEVEHGSLSVGTAETVAPM